MPPPDVRPRRWRKRLIAAALSLGLSFLLVELVARALFGVPLPERLPLLRVQANDQRGWEMVPGELHYTYEEAVTINALGLRGPELGPKREGELRLLALGDSLVYGQGVADDQTLPAHLERELGAPWTVVNAGHRAYDTAQEIGLLEELGEELAPDVVVLFWYRNDFLEREIGPTAERLRASGPISFDVGRPLEGATLWKWRAKQLARRSTLVMTLYDRVKKKHGDQIARETPAGLERLDGYLDRFVAQCERLGARPLVCAIPGPDRLAEEDLERSPDREVLELAREHGLFARDLLPALLALREATGSIPTVPFDGHYAGPSNEALARAVAGWVREALAKDAAGG